MPHPVNASALFVEMLPYMLPRGLNQEVAGSARHLLL
jgi:hypothetical protein